MNEVKPFQDPSRNTPTIRVGEKGPEEVVLARSRYNDDRWTFDLPVPPALWRGEGPRCPARFADSAIECELVAHHTTPHYASRSSV